MKISSFRAAKSHFRSRRTLLMVIGNDFLRHGKMQLCLFFFIIITAFLVVTTVHYTRLLTDQHEKMLLESNALDIEWQNLILNINKLNNHARIEKIATEKLKMQHISSLQENIIIQN